MKRCPDCGFRVKDPEIRTCPLCGVRMLHDPDGQTVQYPTHVHQNKADCMLPNQDWKKTDAKPQTRPEKKIDQLKQPVQATTNSSFKLLMGIAAIIVFSALKSCS